MGAGGNEVKWLIADSLSCPEQFFCSHLSSYSHYLRGAGEEVRSWCLNIGGDGPWDVREGDSIRRTDVVFALDQYDRVPALAFPEYERGRWNGERWPRPKFIAQVAAITDPLPWDVRKPDGSPAYDLVISSLMWMVEEAKRHGCRAEFQRLAFDHRALVCSMGVQKDIDCLFVGTVDGNHVKRAKVLHELGDLVTVAPPTFGREYYRLIARSKTCIHVSAEWARGERNALRIYEAGGLRSVCIFDCDSPVLDVPGVRLDERDVRASVRDAIERFDRFGQGLPEQAEVLTQHSYIQRIPELISCARSL